MRQQQKDVATYKENAIVSDIQSFKESQPFLERGSYNFSFVLYGSKIILVFGKVLLQTQKVFLFKTNKTKTETFPFKAYYKTNNALWEWTKMVLSLC